MLGRVLVALAVAVLIGCSDAPTIPNPTLEDLVGSWRLQESRQVNQLASSEQWDELANSEACPVPLPSVAFCIYKPLIWTVYVDGTVVVRSTITGTDSLVPVPWEQERVELRGDSLTFERLFYEFTLSIDRLRLSRMDTVSAAAVEQRGFSTAMPDGRIPLLHMLVLDRVD